MTRTRFSPAILHEPGSLPLRVASFARRAWRSYWSWRARQATVLILCSLDERTLRDIGISPGEIESYVYGRGQDRRRVYDDRWPEGRSTSAQAARCCRSVSPR
jgi:uncharacterized protein YjiS (DUF1127 family)